MLSTSKPPFRVNFTIFALLNGFCSVIIADDMRLEHKKSSEDPSEMEQKYTPILGVAVMLPPLEIFGGFKNKCQLVKLDTLVHKSHSFTIGETIKVNFVNEKDQYKSCALISETQAIVFTRL